MPTDPDIEIEAQPKLSAVRAPRLAPWLSTRELRKLVRYPESLVDALWEVARVNLVQVVLRKLGRGSRAVAGRLVRAPRKGSVVVIEFSDGMHEYVTTPVKRVLRLAAKDVFYIETVNSRYRLEVRDRERALEDASSG